MKPRVAATIAVTDGLDLVTSSTSLNSEFITNGTDGERVQLRKRDGRSPATTMTLWAGSRSSSGAYTNALGEQGLAQYEWPLAPYAPYAGSTCWHIPCAEARPDDEINNPSFVYQQTPSPTQISAEGGTTIFDYCSAAATAGLPANEHNRCVVEPVAQSVIDPEGIRTDVRYDGNLNVVEAKRKPKPGVLNPDGSVPAPIITSATYDTALGSKSANKPLAMTDANGRTTRWTYAPEHGGVLTETGPPVDLGGGQSSRRSATSTSSAPPGSPTEALPALRSGFSPTSPPAGRPTPRRPAPAAQPPPTRC